MNNRAKIYDYLFSFENEYYDVFDSLTNYEKEYIADFIYCYYNILINERGHSGKADSSLQVISEVVLKFIDLKGIRNLSISNIDFELKYLFIDKK